jgi:hypothetical protein
MLYNKDWAYKLNPVADVLFKAADLLEKHGHIKRTRGDRKTGMCFLGALEVAQGYELINTWHDTPLTVEASEAVAKTIGVNRSEGYPDYRTNMANWNNEGVRTGQEVIDAMRKTASNLMENAHAV